MAYASNKNDQQGRGYQNKFPDVHPRGSYRLEVIDHVIAEAKESGNPYLTVKVKVVEFLKPAKGERLVTVNCGSHRNVGFFFSEKTREKTAAWLQAAGFTGRSIKQLDERLAQASGLPFASLKGFQFDASNEPEEGTDKDGNKKLRDKFSAYSIKDGTAWRDKVPVANASRLSGLDAFWGSQLKKNSPPAQQTRQEAPKGQERASDEASDVGEPPELPEESWDFD